MRFSIRQLVLFAAIALLCVTGIAAVTSSAPGRAAMLQSASTVGTKQSVSFPYDPPGKLTLYVEWGTGVISGAVTVEEMYDPTYTGTPAPIQTVSFSAANSVDVVHIPNTVGTIQTRVSTAVVGGTVNTYVVASR